jgi:hypothetical protein
MRTRHREGARGGVTNVTRERPPSRIETQSVGTNNSTRRRTDDLVYLLEDDMSGPRVGVPRRS